jgi:hypothetical protein
MYIHNQNFNVNPDGDISLEELSDKELFELKDALIKISVDFHAECEDFSGIKIDDFSGSALIRGS